MKLKPALAICMVVFLSFILIVLAATSQRQISNSGVIETTANIQVYSDSGCTTVLTAINWGDVASPSTNARTIYIKNVGGNAPVTLTLTTQNLPLGYALTWTKENVNLARNTIVDAPLTLTVPNGLAGGTLFNFIIIITGTA